MTRSRAVALTVLLVVAGTTAPSIRTARADEREKCVAAHEDGLSQKRKGRLRAARARFVECSRDACPAVVRKECVAEATGAASSIPTIVVEARDARGNETAEVRVLVDGEILVEQLDGKAIEVDPGEHRFVFEMKDGSRLEQDVLIRQGQKDRTLTVDFSKTKSGEPAMSKAPAVPPAQGTKSKPTNGAPAAQGSGGEPPGDQGVRRGIPAGAWVLGAVGVAGLAGFGVFALQGKAKQDELEKCAPRCTDHEQGDAMRRDYLIADVSLGVGVVALGAATWIALSSGSRKSRAGPTIRISPRSAALGVRF